jgi:hypothetical protein
MVLVNAERDRANELYKPIKVCLCLFFGFQT